MGHHLKVSIGGLFSMTRKPGGKNQLRAWVPRIKSVFVWRVLVTGKKLNCYRSKAFCGCIACLKQALPVGLSKYQNTKISSDRGFAAPWRSGPSFSAQHHDSSVLSWLPRDLRKGAMAPIDAETAEKGDFPLLDRIPNISGILAILHTSGELLSF